MRQDKNVLAFSLAMAIVMLLLIAGGLVWLVLYVSPMGGR